MDSYTDNRFYFPASKYIQSNLKVDPDLVSWLSLGSVGLSLVTMLCGFNKTTAVVYLIGYIASILEKQSLESRSDLNVIVRQQVFGFVCDLGLHLLFFLGLLWKYWYGFNLITVTGVVVLLCGSVLHRASNEALIALSASTSTCTSSDGSANDNFLKYYRERTKVLLSTLQFQKDESLTNSSETTDTSEPAPMPSTVVHGKDPSGKDPTWQNLREVYLFAYESMWKFYVFVNSKLAPMDYYRSKMSQEEKRSYIQSNISRFSQFGRGNLVTLNCAMLLLNFWAFNGVEYFNSTSKWLLGVLVPPTVYLINKQCNINELLAENRVKVHWWSVAGTLILCYAQVNIVWALGLVILTSSL